MLEEIKNVGQKAEEVKKILAVKRILRKFDEAVEAQEELDERGNTDNYDPEL